MKFDFDTFEFTGLIAPGSVVVLAIALLELQAFRAADPAILIAVALVAAYVVGHLVAALGNIIEPLFLRLDIPRLASLSKDDLIRRDYVSPDQWQRLCDLVYKNLHRPLSASDPKNDSDLLRGKNIAKQMFIAVIQSGKTQRVTTFDGLYNLSRGLTIAFLLCLGMAIAAHQYPAACFSVAAAGLAIYRTRKFNDLYGRELIQEFLLLEG